MNQHISLSILRIIAVMTHNYFKCCNSSQIAYKILLVSNDRLLIKYIIFLSNTFG